jgi:hypothetical protein
VAVFISPKIPFRRRLRKRGDGDWDYFPNLNSWGFGTPRYRVDDATRQRMLEVERTTTRRLALIVAAVTPVVVVTSQAGTITPQLDTYAIEQHTTELLHCRHERAPG